MKMAFVNERTEDGKYITIDREKGLLLVYTDQIAAEPIYVFNFTKNEKTAQIFAEQKIFFQGDDRLIVWTVKKIFPDISIDLDFSNTQSEIVTALTCFGAFGAAETRPERNKEISVGFSL